MTKKEWEGAEWAELVIRSEKNLTWDKKLILTVCPVGALFSRNHNPNLPCSPEYLARELGRDIATPAEVLKIMGL